MSGVGVRLRHAGLELGGRAVLAPLTLEVPPGAHLLLAGANGAGKTQLLKLLAGERWPTPTGRERREYRDAGGRLLELHELLPRIVHLGGERQDKYLRYGWDFSVERIVASGCRGQDRPPGRLTAAESRRVRGLLRRLGLWALRRRRLLTLSYGERRRALLARALAARPRLLLLDEPYNGLDAVSRALFERELGRLARTQMTIVLATHRLEEAPTAFRRAVVLRAGRLVHDGGPRAARRWLAERPAARPAALRPPRPMPRRPLVELRGVTIYRDYRPVLRDLDWVIGPGEHWAILGGNGSGKSTLLKLLAGDLAPALGGELRRRGHPPGTHLQRWRRRLGVVSPELQAEYFERISLEGFVVSGLRGSIGLDEPPRAAERRRARAALARVGLELDPERIASELSYGQRRLALFARALVGTPEALLLDEPLTGLDVPLRARVRGLMSALAAEGVQLVVAAHHGVDLVPEIGHVLRLVNGRARPARRRGRRPGALRGAGGHARVRTGDAE